jgi:hypothetical protein
MYATLVVKRPWYPFCERQTRSFRAGQPSALAPFTKDDGYRSMASRLEDGHVVVQSSGVLDIDWLANMCVKEGRVPQDTVGKVGRVHSELTRNTR